jgi:intein/homing endonuclease
MQQILLRYPNKSHRKVITLPPESTDLAELVGILFGDGGVGNNWQITVSLNSIADLEYSTHVYSLFGKLFHLKPSIRKRPNQNTLTIVCSSMNLLDFLISKGVVRGNKILQEFDIPEWIKTNSEYKKSFVRGLVDTDGCLYIHQHKVGGKLYKNLGLCFTSYSKRLLQSTASIFEEFRIKPYITNQHRNIYLYSYKAVLKYLDTFGSPNPRILRKYDEWRGRLVV